jgi:hypothetical protein
MLIDQRRQKFKQSKRFTEHLAAQQRTMDGYSPAREGASGSSFQVAF